MRIHTAQILVFLFIGCLFLLSSATNFDSEGPLADAIRNRKTKMEGKNRARNDQTHPGVWHDLVGKDGDEAVNTIKSQHPGFHVITVPHVRFPLATLFLSHLLFLIDVFKLLYRMEFLRWIFVLIE
jgi:hypothetical protein